ncbi:MAG: hypothetical protein HYV26_16325, partial [Candidatus Hydrogenedentes bacterium]|nr:hypothetical protein [Candidatus Hydrogenedentota bacterium]
MGISRTAPALVICALLSSSLTFAAPPENGREAASPPSAVSSPASSPEAVAPSTALTPELLSAQRQAIESNQALAPEIRTKALDLYTQALDHLRAVEVFRNQAAAYQDLAQSAPELAQQIQEDLDTPVPPPDLTDWREVPLVQLEQALATAETGLTAKQQQLQDQESGPQRRAERQSILPGLLVTARSRLQEALAQLQRPEGEDPAAVAARQAALQAEMEHLNSEVTAYEQELLSYGVTSAYDTLLQDQARRDAATAEKWVKALRELVEQQREEEARLAAEEARRTMEQMLGAAPAVQALFHDVVTLNTQLAEQRTQPEGVIKKLALASQQNEQLTQRLTEVRAQYQSVQERIKVAGHSESVGMLLRRYKSELPNLRLLNQQIREHGAGIAETDLALIDAREQRAAVADIEQRVADILEKLPPSYNEDARTQIANTMRAQLQSQRDLLQALNQDYQRYSTQLNTLVSQERELATVVGEFGDFIDANILWSGGARILRPSDLANIHEALYWLIAPDAWQKTLSGLTDDLLGNPLHYGLATLSFLILLYCCVAFRPRLQALGEQARKKWHTTYNQTPAALAITFIQTLPAPLVLAFTAWRLAAVQGTLFPGALAQGLTSVAVLCLVLGFTRQMFMPLGLVEAHFEWTAG